MLSSLVYAFIMHTHAYIYLDYYASYKLHLYNVTKKHIMPIPRCIKKDYFGSIDFYVLYMLYKRYIKCFNN